MQGCELLLAIYFPVIDRARGNETPVTQLEIICLDQHGVSQLLLDRSTEAGSYAFDLLWLSGTGLKDFPH
jgi:hypothetical protein